MFIPKFDNLLSILEFTDQTIGWGLLRLLDLMVLLLCSIWNIGIVSKWLFSKLYGIFSGIISLSKSKIILLLHWSPRSLEPLQFITIAQSIPAILSTRSSPSYLQTGSSLFSISLFLHFKLPLCQIEIYRTILSWLMKRSILSNPSEVEVD